MGVCGAVNHLGTRRLGRQLSDSPVFVSSTEGALRVDTREVVSFSRIVEDWHSSQVQASSPIARPTLSR